MKRILSLLTALALAVSMLPAQVFATEPCEHAASSVENALDPTCTDEGYSGDTVCSDCGEVLAYGYPIPATEHSYTEEVTEPTCIDYGYTTFTCSLCGDSYTDSYTEPVEHTYEEEVTEPTCITYGYTIFTCSSCGDGYQSDMVDPLEHSWDEGTVTIEPTEETEGEMTYSCTFCGETYTEYIPMLDHEHVYTTEIIEPDCWNSGYTLYSCPCGDSYADDYVDPLEHSYTEEITEPTCEDYGYTTYSCSLCGDSYADDYVYATGHSYTEEITEPTCTDYGYTTYTCSSCGYSYDGNYVYSSGHIWDEGTVTLEPTEETGGEMTFACTICQETYTEYIPVLDHVHAYTETVIAPTCTQAGYTTYDCTCGDSYRDSETEALSHSWDEGQVTTTPTLTANGEIRYTCTACGETEVQPLRYSDPSVPAISDLPDTPVTGTEVFRIAGADRFETAFMVANQMKENLGVDKFNAIIVASGINFADALSGSYLASVKQAPILLSFNEAINDRVKDYIRQNLAEDGIVYILGGETAVPDSIRSGLPGITVKRLAGTDRFGTNLAILEEAGVGDKPVLVCTGIDFADSLSCSATGLPILLVFRTLNDDQKAFLESLNDHNDLYVIGGESAVGTELLQQISTYGFCQRLGGSNRFETSVKIAEKFVENPSAVVLAYAWNFPDGLCGGALASTMNAPLILTMTNYEDQAADYAEESLLTQGAVLGGTSLISDDAVLEIFAYAQGYARYTVTFDSNGGTAVASQTILSGRIPERPEAPTMGSYTFIGWYTDEALRNPYDFLTPIGGDLTLYAKWGEPEQDPYVTFMLNDGTDSAYRMQLVPYGSKAARPDNPSLELYRFIDWYTEPETVNKFDFSTPVTGDTFLYARWGDPEREDDKFYAAGTGGGTTYSISGIEMGDGQVTTTLNANAPAILVVRFYADTEELFQGDFADAVNAPELLATVSARTPSYCELVPVVIPVTDPLPRNYYITADLYNDQGEQLCNTYVSITQTSLYEIFDKKTTADFDSDLVLKFTEENDNNFGVLSETVQRIESDDTTNILTVNKQAVTLESEDEVAPVDECTYIFENPDETLKNLQAGDSIYIENTTYLFKIESITEEDGKLILTESSDVELSDFYQYLKVDMDVENEEQERSGAREWEVLDSKPSFSIGIDVTWSPKDWLELNLGGSVTGEFNLKIVYDLKVFAKDYLFIESTVKAEFKVNGGVTVTIDNGDSVAAGTEKLEYDIIKVGVPTPVAGLTIEIKPSVPIELEAKASFNFEYHNNVTTGFTYSSYDGRQNVDDKEYSVKAYFQGEASAKIGPKLKISIAFCKSILEAGLNASAGVKFEAKTNEVGHEATDAAEKHGCTLCVEGTAKWYYEVYADVTYCVIKDVLEGEIGKWYIVNREGNFPISPNFYVSLINSDDSYFEGNVKFGWGECPNTCYRTTFITQDGDGNEVSSIPVAVTHDRTGSTRDGESRYRVYLYKGSYTASATIDGIQVRKSVAVTDGAQEIILTAESADGNVYGKVVDAVTGNPVSGARVVISQNGINIASAISAADGSYQVKLADGTYLITTSKEGYQTFRDHATISNAITSYLQTTQLVPEEDEGARGGFAGRVVDNVTGQPISGVRLEVRAGWNHPDQGEIIDVLYTDSNGNFRYELRSFLGIQIGLEPGEYTLTATKEGYTDTSHNVTVVAGTEKGDQGFAMSPKLGEGQYRIELRWGYSPSDLDSHLVAPVPGGGTFHLYYPDAETYGGHAYSSYFTLDLDDTTSYGPETTTITQVTPGKYYFYVHNYSGWPSIVGSNANVKVYYGDSQMVFNVPLDQGDGLYWNVFVLDTESQVITPINTITDSPDAYSRAEGQDEILAMIAEDIASHTK